MPERYSTSRSEGRRRDRHKVYAATEHQQEGEQSKISLPPDNSSLCAAPRKGENENELVGASAMRSGGGGGGGGDGGVRGDAQDRSHPAAVKGNVGSVGPGAEPPVAVASRAFAHEQPHADTLNPGAQQASKGNPSPRDEEMVSLGGENRTYECFDGDKSPKFSGREPIDNSHPVSMTNNNEEEAETLPDSFNLSDEYGLDGASTGRIRNDEDDNTPSGEPTFFGLPLEPNTTSSRRWKQRGGDQDRPALGLNDVDSPNDRQRQQGKCSRGRPSSESESSDCWSPSSRDDQRSQPLTPPQQLWLEKRRRRPRRPLSTATRRNSQIAPYEDVGDPSEAESAETRRHRRARNRSNVRNRSPSPRRQVRVEDRNHRRRRCRGASGQDSHDGGGTAPTDTESLPGKINHRFEAEMARLRRENKALKQQQERAARLSNAGPVADSWATRYATHDNLPLREHAQRPSRRRNQAPHTVWHRGDRSARTSDALKNQEQHQSQSPVCTSHPREFVCAYASSRDGPSPSRAPAPTWSDFVAKSNSSPRPKAPAAGWLESSEIAPGGVDVRVPRVLVEGGFLWKVPYHNAGTPKRRWFQIKSAEGLLTTSTGRLVVRPTSAGGGGRAGTAASGWDGSSASFGVWSGDGGSEKDAAAASMPMIQLRAAWPITFMWVDPERDLRRCPPRELCIDEVVDLARGHKTPAFWQQAAHRGIHTLPDPKLCFSLVGNDRTLDLAAESLPEAKEWVRALARVMMMVRQGGAPADFGYASKPRPWSGFEPPHLDPEGGGTIDADNVGSETVSQAGEKRRSAGVPAPLADPLLHVESSRRDSFARSEATFVPKKSGVLGEGGAWSVDTIRAWRRRLFPAVTRGDVAAVLALFDQGCPVDLVQTGTGDTAMLLACRLGDVEMARECLRRGSRNDPHPDFGQTALHAAVASGQESCARLLLETAAPSRSDAVISNHRDPNKETPLHVACRRGYGGIVEALLHHGADLRAVDRKGNTPLHGAAAGGHAGALASLLDVGGDSVLEERNAGGDRALHAAAAAGHVACVKLLLGTAAEPDIPNNDGHTPFALASRGGHLAVTRLIREYAPAAGTPLGGDAQIQARGPESAAAGDTAADALPRPHASSSASTGPGTPDHRRRDVERRYFSAAGLDHKSSEASVGGRGELYPFRPGPRTTTIDAVDRGLSPKNRDQERSSESYCNDGEFDIPPKTSAPPASDGRIHSPRPCSSATGHGSLFDGLQVYVVGGRQPLGSQHTSVSAAHAPSPPHSARTRVLNSHRVLTASRHHHHHQQQQSYSSATYRAPQSSGYFTSFSTGFLESSWGGSIPSAPSTVAPSPPVPEPMPTNDAVLGGGSMVDTETSSAFEGYTSHSSGVPGSARALARMIHFSNNNSVAPFHAADWGQTDAVADPDSATVDPAAAAGGDDGDDGCGGSTGRAAPEAIGPWMTSGDGNQDTAVLNTAASTRASDRGYSGDTDIEGVPTPRGLHSGVVTASSKISSERAYIDGSIPGGWVPESGATGTTGRHDIVSEDNRKGRGEGEDSFFIESIGDTPGRDRREGLAPHPPTGLWRVFQSQGYPYYLHEASGHSQWEDPRESEIASRCQELLMTAETCASASARGHRPDGRFEARAGAELKKEAGIAAAVAAPPSPASTTDRKGEDEQPPPASPTKPTEVPVAVKVSGFDGAAAPSIPQRAEIKARKFREDDAGRPVLSTSAGPTPDWDARSEGEREEYTDEGAGCEPWYDVDEHANADDHEEGSSLVALAKRTEITAADVDVEGDGDGRTRGKGARDRNDDQSREEEDEEHEEEDKGEEEWWQELDDQTTGETKH